MVASEMTKEAKKLDKKDWKLLYHLCQDARLSHSKLGKLVGLSKNAVTYRIERLKEKGIIKKFFTIVNHDSLGFNFFNILLRLNATKEQEKGLIDYLISHKNVSVVDSLVGEWNFLVEFGCKDIVTFYDFLSELKINFSHILDTYETHFSLFPYKVEQLPVELVEEKQQPKPFVKTKPVEVDETDLKLLLELDKNSTATLFDLAKSLGITYETVSTRIKKLKENGTILKITAQISLAGLGYDVYVLLLDIRNLSQERESVLRGYINGQKNIRYAFLSATRPVLFIYLAVKKSDDLNIFLLNIKEKFADVIVNQKYLLSPENFKYKLFPEGLIK